MAATFLLRILRDCQSILVAVSSTLSASFARASLRRSAKCIYTVGLVTISFHHAHVLADNDGCHLCDFFGSQTASQVLPSLGESIYPVCVISVCLDHLHVTGDRLRCPVSLLRQCCPLPTARSEPPLALRKRQFPPLPRQLIWPLKEKEIVNRFASVLNCTEIPFCIASGLS